MCRNRLSLEKFSYALQIILMPLFCGILVSRLNVHRDKKCLVFHICLFNERCDFCDFDVGCSNVSRNFVMQRTRVYWIIKKKPKIGVLIQGGTCGSCNFQPCWRVGSVIFVPKGGGGPCVFINHISKCSGPPPPHTFWPVPKDIPFFLCTSTWSQSVKTH